MLISPSQPLWTLPEADLQAALQSPPGGLSAAEAERRLQRWGPNTLPPQPRTPLLQRLAEPLLHTMALLLWLAGGLAMVAGTPQLAWAIWAVVLINGAFSFWQDVQAERTLAALQQALPRHVRVWRGGQLLQVDAAGLVPGDRIELEEGERVPADARLVQASGLSLNLAALTGESLPRSRHADPISAADPDLPLRERANLALAGCSVSGGHGVALVVATGADTEFGHVAHLAAGTTRGASTLERQVARIVRTVTTVAVVLALVSFLLSWLLVGLGPLESLVFAVGILVANVPEGLLPTVTLALAISARRMAARQALVRRLSAVDTLGSVSVICSDKTGTLTANRMALEAIWLASPATTAEAVAQAEATLLASACLCSNAHLLAAGDGQGLGDPTETALLVAARERGLDPEQLRRQRPRQRELPFDSQRRRMAVLVAGEGVGLELLCKGAPAEVIGRCGGDQQPALAAANDLARRGYRVLAVARRGGGAALLTAEAAALEQQLELLGLVGLDDPPRPEVPEAIRQCRQAGIRVTMVTGDGGLTAQAIARQIGLLDPAPEAPAAWVDPVRVIEGEHLQRLSEAQLRQLLRFRHRLVFARMAPEQKLRLVQAYRALGEVVAVTGDGINDAPALRAADVGVAMGRVGTEVAREAADIVLLDDNFATIVMAVRHGRAVVANIGRFLPYVLASNVAEMAPFLAMVALRIPAALTVLQILAVDLGTDLLPALGLGAEAPEATVMHRPPRNRDQPLLDRPLMVRAYLVLGLSEAVAAMAAYLLAWRAGGVDLAGLRRLAPLLLHHQAPPAVELLQRQASGLCFAAIVAGQIGVVLVCRGRQRWRPNGLIWGGVAAELVFTGLLLAWHPLAELMAMAPPPLAWLAWLPLVPLLVLAVAQGRSQ
ncbi:MAG: cation-transporting P-type ATPase [Cyanobacteriota bacterium]|nr:cation-transporting P-type ATPase [Cyanobacteriota bacterium]